MEAYNEMRNICRNILKEDENLYELMPIMDSIMTEANKDAQRFDHLHWTILRKQDQMNIMLHRLKKSRDEADAAFYTYRPNINQAVTLEKKVMKELTQINCLKLDIKNDMLTLHHLAHKLVQYLEKLRKITTPTSDI